MRCALTVLGLLLLAAEPARAIDSYAEAQARAMEVVAEHEAREGDPVAAEQFRALAAQARSTGAVTLADLPQHWREGLRTGRRDTSEARDRITLMEVERRLASIPAGVRLAHAARVAHAEVDTFHARHVLTAPFSWNTWAGNLLHHAEADLEGIDFSDRDGDGILDAVDRCPDEPEDFDHFEDEDGCPDLGPATPPPSDRDRDGDGIPDKRDLCPSDPETRNGMDDHDGCPDGMRPVHFDSDGARLDATAIDTLVANARIINADRRVRVRLEGNTDAENGDAYNVELGRRRAVAVLRYLVDVLEVDASQLTTHSHGEGNPVASNDDAGGRHRNRRVDFVVTIDN